MELLTLLACLVIASILGLYLWALYNVGILVREKLVERKFRKYLVTQFGVPAGYCRLAFREMEKFETNANELKKSSAIYQELSKQELVALAIFQRFRQECRLFSVGHEVARERLLGCGVTEDEITRFLAVQREFYIA